MFLFFSWDIHILSAVLFKTSTAIPQILKYTGYFSKNSFRNISTAFFRVSEFSSGLCNKWFLQKLFHVVFMKFLQKYQLSSEVLLKVLPRIFWWILSGILRNLEISSRIDPAVASEISPGTSLEIPAGIILDVPLETWIGRMFHCWKNVWKILWRNFKRNSWGFL